MAEGGRVGTGSSTELSYCYKCEKDIVPVLPDYTCPDCGLGFLERRSSNSGPSARRSTSSLYQDGDEQVEIDMDSWDEEERELYNQLRSDDDRLGDDSDEDTDQRAERRALPRNDLGRQFPHGPMNPGGPYFHHSPAMMAPGMLFAEPRELFGQIFQRLGMGFGGSSGMVHGRPGDYVWGNSGLDSVISQLQVRGPSWVSRPKSGPQLRDTVLLDLLVGPSINLYLWPAGKVSQQANPGTGCQNNSRGQNNTGTGRTNQGQGNAGQQNTRGRYSHRSASAHVAGRQAGNCHSSGTRGSPSRPSGGLSGDGRRTPADAQQQGGCRRRQQPENAEDGHVGVLTRQQARAARGGVTTRLQARIAASGSVADSSLRQAGTFGRRLRMSRRSTTATRRPQTGRRGRRHPHSASSRGGARVNSQRGHGPNRSSNRGRRRRVQVVLPDNSGAAVDAWAYRPVMMRAAPPSPGRLRRTGPNGPNRDSGNLSPVRTAYHHPSFVRFEEAPASPSPNQGRGLNLEPYFNRMRAALPERLEAFLLRHPNHGRVSTSGRAVAGIRVVELLNNMEGAGPPPADRDRISSLPKIKITEQQAGQSCTVCFDEFTVGEEVSELPCRHLYHTESCIVPWLRRHGTCPVCRKDLQGDNTASNDVNERIMQSALDEAHIQTSGPSSSSAAMDTTAPGPSSQAPGPSSQASGPSSQNPGPSSRSAASSSSRPGPTRNAVRGIPLSRHAIFSNRYPRLTARMSTGMGGQASLDPRTRRQIPSWVSDDDEDSAPEPSPQSPRNPERNNSGGSRRQRNGQDQSSLLDEDVE